MLAVLNFYVVTSGIFYYDGAWKMTTEFQHGAKVNLLVDDSGSVTDILIILEREEIEGELVIEPFEGRVNFNFNDGSLSSVVIFGLIPEQAE